MTDVLAVLISERDRLDRAIAVLQGAVPRRGRPPGRRGPGRPPGSGRAKGTVKKGRRGGTMSVAARKAASERMKKYWAERRKAARKRIQTAGKMAAARKKGAN